MNDSYSTWLALLSEHESLLAELEANLNEEREALLANEVTLLRESSLRKDRTVSRIEDFQNSFSSFKERVANESGLANATLNLLFNRYEGDERRTLQHKRIELQRRSRTIQRFNKFNEDCLKTHIGHLNIFATIFGMAAHGSPTYTSGGAPLGSAGGGRLVSRSL